MEKNNFKEIIRNLVLLILLVLLIFFLYKMSAIIEKKVNKTNPKNDLVEEVSQKLEKEVIAFIRWVNKEYPDSLKKMLKLLDNTYEESMWHTSTGYSYKVLKDFYQKKYDGMNNVTILKNDKENTLSFVGDVSLADNWYIMPEYDKRGKGVYGILSEDTVSLMKKSTLMVANSEFTVSTRGSAMKGKQYTFRADPARLKIYEEMGVDLVTLANNHVYDYGQEAFFDMLDAFDQMKMPRIGAGRNLEEAARPYYFIINGYKFAFLNATRAEKYILTPGATETSEGVFRCYDPTNMINQIKTVKEESDYVIAIIHFGKEGFNTLEYEQIESSHQYIDAGADAVVGHHAHVLQGIEFYNHKPIIYNLGNFIFNADTIDTAIFQMKLKDDGSFQYYMIPALQKDEYTSLLQGEEKQNLINLLNEWCTHAMLKDDGELLEKGD